MRLQDSVISITFIVFLCYTSIIAQRGLLAPVFNAASRLAGMSHYNYKDESLSKYSFENLVGQAGENIYRGIKAATHIGDIVQGIAVGTRWCGNGNISRNDNDVGEFKETDECCRAHDMCASNIAARRREMNLKLQNDGTFTRSSCKCDGAFYKCLIDSRRTYSNTIGKLYFDVLGPRCFEYTFNVLRCAETKNNRCIVHVFDGNSQKGYHWFDNPTYCQDCVYPDYRHYWGVVEFHRKTPGLLEKTEYNEQFPVVNSLDPLWNILMGTPSTGRSSWFWGRK